jgi:uncharacterized membrane protein
MLQILAWGLLVLTLAVALAGLSPGQLREPLVRRLLAAATVGLGLLWSLEAQLVTGLSFHFLGVTTVTLLVGWRLAVLCVTVVSALLLVGGGSLQDMPSKILINGLVPVLLSHGACLFSVRFLPPHPFVFIFVCAFAGGGLCALGVALLTALRYGVFGGSEGSGLAGQYLRFLPLYAFPEGVLNGMLTTALVLTRPNWVRAFRGALRQPS